ncbi:MAG: hypothetical protein FWF53_12780 [Candidatus Azobacteroides sp.]|nr:hypothetical protein [Candidatus Azobacteroides sp.]
MKNKINPQLFTLYCIAIGLFCNSTALVKTESPESISVFSRAFDSKSESCIINVY